MTFDYIFHNSHIVVTSTWAHCDSAAVLQQKRQSTPGSMVFSFFGNIFLCLCLTVYSTAYLLETTFNILGFQKCIQRSFYLNILYISSFLVFTIFIDWNIWQFHLSSDYIGNHSNIIVIDAVSILRDNLWVNMNCAHGLTW